MTNEWLWQFSTNTQYALSSKGNDLGEQNIILDAHVRRIVSSQKSDKKNHPILLIVIKKGKKLMTPPVQQPI